jgi:hypothetical protein
MYFLNPRNIPFQILHRTASACFPGISAISSSIYAQLKAGIVLPMVVCRLFRKDGPICPHRKGEVHSPLQPQSASYSIQSGLYGPVYQFPDPRVSSSSCVGVLPLSGGHATYIPRRILPQIIHGILCNGTAGLWNVFSKPVRQTLPGNRSVLICN